MGTAAVLSALAAMAMLPGAAGASPPPPPPAAIDELAAAVVPTLTAATFDLYAARFADNLALWVNGRRLVGGKAAWLAEQQRRLGRVERRVIGYAEGGDALLVLDEYDDRSDVPAGMHADPRFVTRSTRYEVGTDDLVHVVRIEEVAAFLQRAR